MFQPGDLVANKKYRVEQLVGRGAYGHVYRATHLELKVERAIKVLRRDAPGLGSADFRNHEARFALEARLGARLDGTYLVRVYDFERDGETLLLVMEFAVGGSLSARLERARQTNQSLPVDECLRIAIDAAQGLEVLHANEIVHRDLKPSNLLFDGVSRVRIADLGLAQIQDGLPRQASVEGSRATPHPGTPAYMSPEQQGTTQYLTPASDVYALGLVLFEMLTLKSFKLQKPNTRARQLRVDAPAWFDALLSQMLANEVDKRPWDADEVARLLIAQKPSPPRRTFHEPEPPGEVLGAPISPIKPVNLGEPQPLPIHPAVPVMDLRDALDTAIRLAEWEEADELLQQLERVSPDNPSLRVYRKRVDKEMIPILAQREREAHAQKEREEQARREQEAQAQREREEQARREKLEEARRQQQEREQRERDKAVREFYERGKSSVNQQDYNSAIAAFSKAIELNPAMADCYWQRGVTYYKKAHDERREAYDQVKADNDRAIADYSKAIELNSGNPEYYNSRALSYLAKANYDWAIVDYSKAIELNPTNAYYYYSRGLIYGSKGFFESEFADYSKAIELNPANANYYYSRSESYRRQGNYEEEIADLSKAIELNPAAAHYYYLRGMAFDKRRDHRRAITDYTRSIELKSEMRYFLARSWSYRDIGDKAREEADLKEVRGLYH